MTINYLNVQQRQHGHGSLSESTEGVGINSGFVPNANGLRARCAGMFAAVKEYFWPTQTDVIVPALTRRAIDVESAGECDAEQDHPEQSNRYGSTIKCVMFAAAAAGIAATAWWVRSAFYANGDAVKPIGVTPDALSAGLATTVLIGRRLLSVSTVTNAIANQSVFANASFNLQVDLSEVFNYSGDLADIRFLQADGTPLPGWLRMSITPVLVGSITTTYAIGVAVIGNYAYVADWYGGLKIIDVTNKANPILVGSSATTSAQGTTVVGNYAYVADDYGGLKIIDVSNKTRPNLVGSAATQLARDVTVVGNYAYVADGKDGLIIIDVSNKTRPILVGSEATGTPYSVTVIGNYAYTANKDDGLKIIDVSNKTSPILVASAAIDFPRDVTVIGNYAYVADDSSGLKIIDVSNKTSPILVGSAAFAGNAYGVTVVGSYAYVADFKGNLKIIDVSNKTSPIIAGSASTTGYAYGVTVVGNHAYVADYCSGLKIFSSDKTLLSGTPSPLNRGILPIKLTITDTLSQTASVYFSITVLNHPPTAPTIPPQTVHHAFNWTIPEFSDSDGDVLTYSATLVDGSPLPDWVSFNPTTRILSGVVPPVVTVRKINIHADDSHGGIANATQTITVVNAAPIAGSSALPNQNVKPAIPFNFSLDTNVFTDPDGDPLICNATVAGQQPLPNWLIFNQSSEMFTGIAPEESIGLTSIIIAASDLFGAAAARSFDLHVVGAPQLVTQLSNLLANVGAKFSFVVPDNIFKNPNPGIEKAINYTAALAAGAALPAWLTFDPTTRTFAGIPSRKDTNALSSRPLSILLTAHNDIGATSIDFIINVVGESDVTLAIKICGSVGTAFSVVGAVYAKRNAIWKRTMKCVYKQPTKHIVFGQESSFCHPISRLNPANVGSVKLLRNGCSLPGKASLPAWLIYDSDSATLTIDAGALEKQDGLTNDRWTVQVKNKGGYVNGLVWEEFDITFGANDESREMASPAGIRIPSDMLREPLLSTQ